MKKDPIATAHALAVTTAIIYVVCALFFILAPDVSMAITKTLFHGIDISSIDGRTNTISSFVLGLVTATISAWLAGYIFALLYNSFAKKDTGT